jgi:hypothetical protein
MCPPLSCLLSPASLGVVGAAFAEGCATYGALVSSVAYVRLLEDVVIPCNGTNCGAGAAALASVGGPAPSPIGGPVDGTVPPFLRALGLYMAGATEGGAVVCPAPPLPTP